MFAVARGTPVFTWDKITKSLPWSSYVVEHLSILLEFLFLFFKMFSAVLQSCIQIIVPPREKSLAGEIALVTGSGHGIGRELMLKLAGEGATVIGWDVNEEANAETRKILKECGYETKSHFYKCDVSSRDEVLALAKQVEDEVGPVSVLFNNAGIMICQPLSKQTPLNIQRVFNVNTLSHFWTLEAFLPKMKERDHGHIVAICSICGVIGCPNAAPYSASKFAVRGLMETLSEEMRICEKNTSIKFTTVYPMTVDTGLAKRPRHRFPSLIKILSTEEVAGEVVRAVKQELHELSIPSFLLPIELLMRLLPLNALRLAKDFMDTGVDPE